MVRTFLKFYPVVIVFKPGTLYNIGRTYLSSRIYLVSVVSVTGDRKFDRLLVVLPESTVSGIHHVHNFIKPSSRVSSCKQR